jgi:hypothetical protein
MSIPNHAAKTRQIGIIHQNNAAIIATPNQRAAIF